MDIVINNATVAPLGSVLESQITDWDRSYYVNLRGPVLLAQAFLPELIVQDQGAFVCISSVGQAFMGPYEILKTAQVELADTLDAELTDSEVAVLTVAPGFVPTATAMAGIEFLAGRMGLTLREMRSLVADNELSVEAAGAGVAAAAALAPLFAGQEIGAIQALHAAGILLEGAGEDAHTAAAAGLDFDQLQRLAQVVYTTLSVQAAGWEQRSFFERQWLGRSFKKEAGKPVDRWLAELDALRQAAADADAGAIAALDLPLNRLAGFYQHLQKAARSYVKDPAELHNQLQAVEGWRQEVLALQNALAGVDSG